VFDIENAEFQKIVLCMTGNFPPTRSDMPIFFQSYKRELHECKGLNTRKEGKEEVTSKNVNTEYRLLQNTTIKYELRSIVSRIFFHSSLSQKFCKFLFTWKLWEKRK
jgi:hypothetical protein